MSIKSIGQNIATFVSHSFRVASNTIQSKVSTAYQFVFNKDKPSTPSSHVNQPPEPMGRNIILSEKNYKEGSERAERSAAYVRRHARTPEHRSRATAATTREMTTATPRAVKKARTANTVQDAERTLESILRKNGPSQRTELLIALMKFKDIKINSSLLDQCESAVLLSLDPSLVRFNSKLFAVFSIKATNQTKVFNDRILQLGILTADPKLIKAAEARNASIQTIHKDIHRLIELSRDKELAPMAEVILNLPPSDGKDRLVFSVMQQIYHRKIELPADAKEKFLQNYKNIASYYENRDIALKVVSGVPVEKINPLSKDVINSIFAQLDLKELEKFQNNEVSLLVALDLGFCREDFEEVPHQPLAEIPNIYEQLKNYHLFLRAHLVDTTPQAFNKVNVFHAKRMADAELTCMIALQLSKKLGTPLHPNVESVMKLRDEIPSELLISQKDKALQWMKENRMEIAKYLETNKINSIEGYPMPPSLRDFISEDNVIPFEGYIVDLPLS